MSEPSKLSDVDLRQVIYWFGSPERTCATKPLVIHWAPRVAGHLTAVTAELAARDAEIRRLTEQVASLGGCVSDLEGRRNEAQREVGRLREALRPFAQLAGSVDPGLPGYWKRDCELKHDDIRRAAKAMEPLTPQPAAGQNIVD